MTPRVDTLVRPETARRGLPAGRGWAIAAGLMLVPALIPPISLVFQVLSGEAGVLLGPGRLAELMTSTLALMVAVTATALLIGTATAWVTTRTDVPLGSGWTIAAALPLVVPSYVAALALIGATGPGGLLASTFGVVVPAPYGFVGAWLALSIFLAPMAHLIVAPALRRVDPSIEEAAVGLGARRLRVLFTVTLPQVRPALVSSALLIALYTISDFGAVSLLRYDTFTRAIYTLYVGQIDRRPAAALSLILSVLAVVIVLVERATRSRARYSTRRPRRPRAPVMLTMPGKIAATALLALQAILSLVLPVWVMAYWLARGIGAGQASGTVLAETARSLGIAAAAALLTVVAAFPVAMVTARGRGPFARLAESTTWATYALPHIAVGVGMVGFALTAALPLYQSLALLLITYVAMFMAQAMGSTQDSLLRIDPALTDASRGLGKGRWRTLGRITAPLATPGLLAGAGLVFLSVMKELPATLLLRPNGFETLAVRIWSATGEGFYTRAAVAGLTLLAVSIVPLLAVTRRDLSD
jgi:iron(III) transport system permease protein